MPEMNDYAKVRKWQVQFEVHRPFATLPLPDIVVEEERSSPLYRLDGRLRGDSGGQLSITLGGRGGIRIAGVDHPLTPGRAFLHNHGDRDVCYYYPSDGTEVWNFLWMAFDGDYVKTLIAEINRKYGYLFDVPLKPRWLRNSCRSRITRTKSRCFPRSKPGRSRSMRSACCALRKRASCANRRAAR